MNRRLLFVAGVALMGACGGTSVRGGAGGDSGDDEDGGAGGTSGSTANGGASGSIGGSAGASVNGGSGGTVPVGGTSGSSGSRSTGGQGGTGASGLGGSGPIAPSGPVLCGGVECEAPRACCLANSRCFDPETEAASCPRPDSEPSEPDRRACASSAHCAADEYCHIEASWLCQGEGYCHSRSNCPSSAYAVCACDGNEYADIGTACRAGANVTALARGSCGQTIDLNGGESDEPRWVTVCGSDAHCPGGERCCALTGLCYPESESARCQLPPAGTRYPCTANDQCEPEYEFCFGNGCSGPGGCARRDNEECGVRLAPVCGCNGISYTSAPCAAAEGTRVQHDGECGAAGAGSE